MSLHPDIKEIRQDDAFHSWVRKQPQWVQDALYTNEDDAKLAARAIDLYKEDKGITNVKRAETTKTLGSSQSMETLGFNEEMFDTFVVAYWAAAKINDNARMSQINDIFLIQSSLGEPNKSSDSQEDTAWFVPSAKVSQNSSGASLHAPRFGYLLSEVAEEYVTPEILKIRDETKKGFSQKQYRSTLDNAKIVSLFAAEKQSLEDTSISIDGKSFDLNEDGILPLSKDQLLNGFEIKHGNEVKLSLNATLIGPRKTRTPIDNGYDIQKWWFDAEGKHVDGQFISAHQGQLFSVVIQINKTSTNRDGDLLVTDLLPAGFEIEDAYVSSPSLSSVGIYEKDYTEPDYQAKMDDRFIAHFENRWYKNEKALLKYVVRSAYTGEVQIGGAHIEHMYAPEINGRSGSARALVIEK